MLPKKALASALWWNQRRRLLIASGVAISSVPAKQNVILLGPSGSGKSALAKAVAALMKVPVFFTPATSYSIPGLVGLDVDDMIAGLVQAAEGKIDVAQTGIVVVDEIDKLRRRDWGGQADVGGESIQQGMLSLIEGCDSFPKIRPGERATVRTEHITFIATGAFEDLQVEAGPVPADDIIRYGFISEFVARFSLRIRMESLATEALWEIATQSESSPIRQLTNLFKMDGIELEFEKGAIEAVIDAAKRDGVGARALNQIVWERCNGLIGELPDLVCEGIGKVVVDRGVIEKGLPAWKIPGDRESASAHVVQKLDQPYQILAGIFQGLYNRAKAADASVTQTQVKPPEESRTDASPMTDPLEQFKSGMRVPYTGKYRAIRPVEEGLILEPVSILVNRDRRMKRRDEVSDDRQDEGGVGVCGGG